MYPRRKTDKANLLPNRTFSTGLMILYLLSAFLWGRYKVGSDQLGQPVLVGSTRINSDWLESSRITKKHKIKWNIETFTQLKVKFRLKMGQIKKDSRRFSVSCCVVKPPVCILSTSCRLSGSPSSKQVVYATACIYRQLYGKIPSSNVSQTCLLCRFQSHCDAF